MKTSRNGKGVGAYKFYLHYGTAYPTDMSPRVNLLHDTFAGMTTSHDYTEYGM
jgi:hypothetical protein